jgi:hypothetical protein
MGATSGEGTAHSSEATRRVLLVEEELPSFRSSTTGVTSAGGTVHSSEITERVPLVEKELPSLQREHAGCY